MPHDVGHPDERDVLVCGAENENGVVGGVLDR
jgi:hypothetical protein